MKIWRAVFKCFSATLPLILLFGATAGRGETIVTKHFVIHHALDAHDFQRFGDIVKELDPYFDHWASSVHEMPDEKIRMYIQPSLSFERKSALRELYGEDFFRQFKIIEKAAAEKSEQLITLLQHFACSFTPFFNRALRIDFSIEQAISYVASTKRTIESSDRFGLLDDNGMFYGDKDYCSENGNAILLGGSSDQTIREHPYLKRDVIFHEIGHAFFYEMLVGITKIPKRDFTDVSSFNEMLADIMASSYLNDPKHNMIKNIETGILAPRRDLSSHTVTLTKSLWNSDSHEAAAAIAHLLWELYVVVGLNDFSNMLMSATREIIPRFIHYHQNYSPSSLKRDFFLEAGVRYLKYLEVLRAFSQRMCMSAQKRYRVLACEHLESEFLGDTEPDMAVAKALIRNSPTTMLDKKQDMVIDATRYIWWFQLDIANGLELVLENPDQKECYRASCSCCGFSREGKRELWIEFAPSQSRSSRILMWNWNGRLQLKEESF